MKSFFKFKGSINKIICWLNGKVYKKGFLPEFAKKLTLFAISTKKEFYVC